MRICQECRAALNDRWHYCPRCGQPIPWLREPPAESPPDDQWEVQEVTVPLDFWVAAPPGGLKALPPRLVEQYDRTLRAHLARVSREGWYADGPTDYRSLGAAGRICWREARGTRAWRRRGAAYRWEAALLRLKRLAP